MSGPTRTGFLLLDLHIVLTGNVAVGKSDFLGVAGATVTDNVAPVFNSGTTATAINENSGAGQVVYDVDATDPASIGGPSNPVTYGLGTAGGDEGAFSINGTTGAVTLTGNPNFETKSSYSFEVVATDAAGNATTQTVTVAINDVNEFAVTAPTDSNATANAIDENATGTVGLTAFASDADATTNTVSYSLVTDITGATAYSGPFSIDSSTGVVSLGTALDRETVGASQTLFVKAASTDGSSAVSQFTVAINDVNEFAVTAPTDSNATANAIDENATGTVGLTAFASDADATTNTVSYSLVTDITGATVTAARSRSTARLVWSRLARRLTVRRSALRQPLRQGGFVRTAPRRCPSLRWRSTT